MTWTVGDEIGRIVKALKDKGVAFEHYDMPGMTLEGDIHVGYDMKVAWFKDPGRQHPQPDRPLVVDAAQEKSDVRP